MRIISVFFLYGCVVVMLLSACSLNESANSKENNLFQVNVKSSLTMRSEPSNKASKVGYLNNGAIVKVMDTKNGWAKISCNGEECYVSNKYLSPYVDSESPVSVAYGETGGVKLWLEQKMPYAIVACLVFIWLVSFIDAFGIVRLFLLYIMGIMELAYVYSVSGSHWFCEPSNVGWIMTCVNFLILLVVLKVQIVFYHTVLEESLGYQKWVRTFLLIVLVIAIFIGSPIYKMSPILFAFWALAVATILFFIFKHRAKEPFVPLLTVLFIFTNTCGMIFLSLSTLMLFIAAAGIYIIFQCLAHSSSYRSSEPEYVDVIDSDGYKRTLHRYANSGTYYDDSTGYEWNDNKNGTYSPKQ